MLKVLADQHELVAALAGPLAVVDGEAFASQVKNVTPLAFLEPEDALGAEHSARQLVVEEVLKFAQ